MSEGERLQYRYPTASVVVPIAFWLGATMLILVVSFADGVRETNRLMVEKQREAIVSLLRQRGSAFQRELKVQTIWSEGYEKVRARDEAWMREFYGRYLERLLGYQAIYVVDGRDAPVYAYKAGAEAAAIDADDVRARVQDLVGAVRGRDDPAYARYRVVEKRYDLGEGQSALHRSVSDVRLIDGRPASVAVLTITPDTPRPEPAADPPFLLIAVHLIDDVMLGEIAASFGYRDLGWIARPASGSMASAVLSGLDGSHVGVLGWSSDFVGWEPARQMIQGVAIAVTLLVLLAFLLTRRSKQAASILKAKSQELARLNETLEHRVSERTHELEVTLANIAQGIVMVRDDGEVVVANERAVQLLDLAPGESIGGRLEALGGRAAASGIGPAGKPLPQSCVATESGRIVEVVRTELPRGGAVIALSDVTMIKRRQAELEAAIQAANGANETKSRFLSTMSHEMRTPLNGVIGALELMSRTALSEEQQELVGIAMESSEALLVHINDVLDFSKMEAGKLVLTAKPFELKRLVQSVIDIVAPQAEQRNNHIESQFHGDLPRYVTGDRVRVRQVLLNLVSNANKFTKNGSVTIRTERVGGSAERPLIEVSVVDTGIGVPQARLGDLFREFSMLDSTYTRKSSGTGLGLAISKRLIEAMGGSVGVSSVEGEGSTFWFRVELASVLDTPSEEPPAIRQRTQSAAALRVLLVDDNATNRLVGSRIVAAGGHAVETVTNGREALERAASERFDVILMDVSMPEMDGMEATRRIRALDEPFRSVRIVALTANAIAGDRERFLAAGMDDYLTKPLRRADLERCLADVAPSAAPALPAAAADEAPLVDAQQLAALASEAGADIVATVVATYAEEMGRRLEEVAGAVAERRIGDLKDASHAIAGASASVGARRAALLARGIEAAAACGKESEALGAAAALPAAVAATLAALMDESASLHPSADAEAA